MTALAVPAVSPKPVFRPELEGLRAFAVLLVVVNHASGFPSGGFVGVDIFFVLSGYLITGLLVAELDRTGTVSLQAFYLRRARRILPAAALVAIVTVLVAALVYFRNRAVQVFWDAVASMLFAQNWHLIRAGTSYFAGDGSSSPMQHYWSLSVEEQFYVLWPWAFVIAVALFRTRPRTRTRMLFGALSVATALSFAISVTESIRSPGWSYFSIESRAWELGAGALLAFVAPRLTAMARRAGALFFVAGLAIIVASAVVITERLPFPGPWAVLPVFGTACVIISGLAGRFRTDRILANGVARFVGRISFSIYLWHYPAIVFTSALIRTHPVVAMCVALVSTFVLSVVSFRFVERPFLSRKTAPRRVAGAKRLPRRSAPLAIAVALVLVVSAAFQMRGPSWILSGGSASAETTSSSKPYVSESALREAVAAAAAASAWPSLEPGPGEVTSADSAASVYQRHGCLNDPVGLSANRLRGLERRCTFGTAPASRTVVAFGDSIAMSWMPAIVDAYVPRGWRVVGIGLESCPAATISVQERVGRAAFPSACDAARADALRDITRMQPALVIMSSSLSVITSQASGAVGAAAQRAVSRGTETTVHRIASSGSRVAVLTAPPESTPPAACAVRTAGPATCLSGLSSAWRTKVAAERSGVAAAGPTPARAVVADTASWFCTHDGRCPAFVGSTLVKADAGHLTAAYAARLGTVLAASLDRLTGGAR